MKCSSSEACAGWVRAPGSSMICSTCSASLPSKARLASVVWATPAWRVVVKSAGLNILGIGTQFPPADFRSLQDFGSLHAFPRDFEVRHGSADEALHRTILLGKLDQAVDASVRFGRLDLHVQANAREVHRHVGLTFAATNVEYALGRRFQRLQIETDLLGHPGRRDSRSGAQAGECDFQRRRPGVGAFVARRLVGAHHRKIANVQIVRPPTEPHTPSTNEANVVGQRLSQFSLSLLLHTSLYFQTS